jgi:hypothetical protein
VSTFIFYTAFSVLCHIHLNGQTRIVLDGPRLLDTARTPLVVVDSFKTEISYLVLDPGKIASIDIIKDSAAILQFGEAGKFGVIFIHAKVGTKFLQADEILDYYNLSDEDKKLRVYINRLFIENAKLILIEQSELDGVEVITDSTVSGGRFINIRTRTKDKIVYNFRFPSRDLTSYNFNHSDIICFFRKTIIT